VDICIPVSEPRSHTNEVLSLVLVPDWPLESEEGVVLHRALPQVLARSVVRQPENKRVLLFLALEIEEFT